MNDLQAIYTEWQNNLAFREAFKKDPVLALKNAGFEVSPDNLAKITALLKQKDEELDKRINK
jgi:hypothetical protein